MINIFLKWFLTFAGCTAGICVVLVPLSAISYIISQIYAYWLTRKFRQESNKFVKEQMDGTEEKEKSSDGTSTPFWA